MSGNTVKIEFDRDRCVGHARCNVMAPEVYHIDDDGYCDLTSTVVGAEFERQARAGADACPEQALIVHHKLDHHPE